MEFIIAVIAIGVLCEISAYVVTGESWLDVYDEMNGRPRKD